jgi:hypothetical protein
VVSRPRTDDLGPVVPPFGIGERRELDQFRQSCAAVLEAFFEDSQAGVEHQPQMIVAAHSCRRRVTERRCFVGTPHRHQRHDRDVGWRIDVGFDRATVLAVHEIGVCHTRPDGRVEAPGALVRGNRRVEEPCVAARMYEPGIEVWLAGAFADAPEQADDGLQCAPGVHFRVGVQVVRE